MNLLCQRCRAILVSEIMPVEDGFEWIFNNEHDVVPSGHFAIGDGTYSELTKDHIIVHLDDLKDMKRPSADQSRGYGCCGFWDSLGPNLVCACGAEIGYELSDCSAPRMAHFSKADVIIEGNEQDAAGQSAK